VTPLAAVDAARTQRIADGLEEFDRVLGGGLVAGGVCCWAAIRASASPRCCCRRARPSARAPHALRHRRGIVEQVALRAQRLGLVNAPVELLAEVQLEAIVAAIGADAPEIVVVDSIQTVYTEALRRRPAACRRCANARRS
jgi:DNA repair protein RadA/Sms